MVKVSNNLVSSILIALMIISLGTTLFVSYYVYQSSPYTGKAIIEGQVNITIISVTPGTSGTTGGGGSGGGGGGGLLSSKTHILDFNKNNFYSFDLAKGDIFILLFPTQNYTFTLNDIRDNNNIINIIFHNLNFNLSSDQLIKIDLDNDSIQDIGIYHDTKVISVVSFHVPTTGEININIIGIDQIVKEPVTEQPQFISKNNISFLILFILLTFLVVFYIQYRRMSYLEKKIKENER